MNPKREGDRVPNVTFHERVDNDWRDVTTDDLFKGKTVIVFSLPGAFTPTCSSSHLPRYNELAPVFFENGIDSILCMSVNDTFVMNEWANDQCCGAIRMVPDGNGEFTREMGMLVDKNDLGFGQRSWRYSMLVKDGVIEKMFIEPDEPGDPFHVSDADTMLNYINAEAKEPDQIVVFTKPHCPYSARAKEMLAARDIPFVEVPLESNIRRAVLGALTGGVMTAPQVFINGKLIGGSDDLEKYLSQ